MHVNQTLSATAVLSIQISLRNNGPATGGGGGLPKYLPDRSRKKNPRAKMWAEATERGVGNVWAVAQTCARTESGKGLTCTAGRVRLRPRTEEGECPECRAGLI